jgi:alpha-2-macroglobulin
MRVIDTSQKVLAFGLRFFKKKIISIPLKIAVTLLLLLIVFFHTVNVLLMALLPFEKLWGWSTWMAGFLYEKTFSVRAVKFVVSGFSLILWVLYLIVPKALKFLVDRIYLFFEPLFSKLWGLLANWALKFRQADLKTRFNMIKKPAISLLLLWMVSKYYATFLPPRIIYIWPENGAVDMPMNTDLEVVFDRPVFKNPVYRTFVFKSESGSLVSGEIVWDSDQVFRFTPDVALERDTTYTLSFSGPVFSKYLSMRLRPGKYSFSTLGHPKVLVAGPQTPTLEDSSPVMVIFDRPMIPLTTVAEKELIEPPFTITPAVGGVGRWLGTTAFQLRPDLPYRKGTEYTVTVDAGIASVDGGVMKEPYVWSFTGELPRVSFVNPQNDYLYANPDGVVKIGFTQKIDLDSFDEHFSLDGPAGSVSGTSFYDPQDETQRTVVFSPDTSLSRGVKYVVFVREGVLGVGGPVGMEATFSSSFAVAPLPKVVTTSPVSGSDSVKNVNEISITFNAPMNKDSLVDNLVITPAPSQRPGGYFNTYQNTFYIRTYLGRSQEYTVTLGGGATDIHGTALGRSHTFSFTTSPYNPSISLQPSGTYFAAYNRDVNPRIVSRVVNASDVTYKLYKLPQGEFMHLYKLRNDWDYAQVKCPIGSDGYTDPKCRNWQTYDSSKLELVKSWVENVDAALNVPVNVITIADDLSGNSLPSGTYFLDVSISSGAHDNMVMIVSNATATVKLSSDQVFVWMTDQSTGEVVSDMKMTLFANSGARIASGVTNSDGVWMTEAKVFNSDERSVPKNTFLIGEKEGDYVMHATDWSSGIDSGDFGIYGWSYYGQGDYKLFVNLDSPIYRPGDTVNFKGVVKKDSDGSFASIQSGDVVKVTLEDVNGSEIYAEDFEVNSYGSFWGNYVLGDELNLGYYKLEASYKDATFPQSFQVEEFRKPEFSLAITPSADSFVSGDKASATVNTSYYFGAPLVGAEVSWTVKRRDYSYRWDKDSRYDFTDSENDYWYYYYSDYDSGDVVTEGISTSNSVGDVEISIPSNISGYNNSQKYVVEAYVSDISNQTGVASKEFVVHKGDYYVGLKPASYVNKSGKDAKVDIVTVDTSGNEVSGKKVSLYFYKRTWYTVKEKDEDTGQFYYQSKAKDTLVDTAEVRTDSMGRAFSSFVPEEGGVYRILAKNTSQGNEIRASTYLWVGGYGSYGRRENHDRIPLITDKNEYFVGDEASIVAGSPYEEAKTTLVTVERANVIDYFVGEVGGDADAYELDITSKYAPNVYVGMLLAKGGSGVKDPPEFKMGYITLPVTNKRNKLALDVDTDKVSYLPQDTMKVTVSVKDGSEVSRSGEVLVGVVDKALWDISDISFADIYEHFYAKRTLDVYTSHLLTMSMDRINANTDLGSKGGSGGGGGMGEFFDTSRTEFLNTAFWKPDVVVGSDGMASVSFDLPDNLTTWKVFAVAVDGAGGFGSGETYAITTKELLIRPFLPRFFSVGDKAQLGAIVMNRTGSDQQATVELVANGLSLKEDAVKHISLDSGTQKKVLWDTEALQGDVSRVGLVAKRADGRVLDAVELELPVVSYYQKQTTATSGEVANAIEEAISVPDNIVPNMGGLDITLAPELAAHGFSGITYMKDYDYYCNEQSASKLISAVVVKDILDKAGVTDINGVTVEDLETMVTTELTRLYSTRKTDGGWGWWKGRPEDSSSPYVTAYVYHALDLASSRGFTVPDSVMSQVEFRMKSFLNMSSRWDAKAFIIYALPDKSQLASYASTAWDNRFNMSLISRAQLASAMHEMPSVSGKYERLCNEILSMVRKTSTSSHWAERNSCYYCMGGDIATTAAVLDMLVKTDKNNPLSTEAVSYLIHAQKNGYWNSTRSTALVLEALSKQILSKRGHAIDESYTVDLVKDSVSKTLVSGHFGKNDLLNQARGFTNLSEIGAGDGKLEISREGKGNLYYSMNFEYYLPFEKVGPVEQGFTVLREFVDNDGNDIEVSRVTAGDDFWTRLTLVVPETRRYVIVEDKLPAGLESVNEQLKDSGILTVDRPELAEGNRYSDYYFYHKEFRDDRTVLFADVLPPGVYEVMYKVRATTPGIYHHAPAQAYQMYFPDVFGHSDGDWMEVVAK